jgi:type II secretory pathway pseudopilin PulG
MKKSEQGFSLLEALISLSLLILFCSTIVPSIGKILHQKNYLKEKSTAIDLLTETLHSYYLGGKPIQEVDVFREQKVFQIARSINVLNEEEVCILWENNHEKNKICSIIKE